MDLKDQIKEYISISDVASLYVSLKPAGKNLKGLCPFHSEKTPSFFVMPERNSFACYGCNRFGDAFTLVQEMEHLSFPESMRFLVEKFHIPVDLSSAKTRSTIGEKDRYYAITELAHHFFQGQLIEGPGHDEARAYLKKRGLSPAVVEAFALGFAPPAWDGLSSYLQAQKADIAVALELGLLVRNDKGRIYDRFRNRIIFPIFSESGRILAFGGRAIGDEEPKYLNSPDTPIYRKGHHLYGFHLTRERIRQENRAVLVEGYLDLISLYQHGVEPVAASLGTALTEPQVNLLKRFAKDIFVFYDRDKAGIAATLRAIERFFAAGVNPRVIQAPDGKDPDDYIRLHGLAGFRQLQDQAETAFRFLISRSEHEFDVSIPEQKRAAIDRVVSFLHHIGDPLIRNEYLEQTAAYFHVDQSLLAPPPPTRKEPAPVPTGDAMDLSPVERELLLAIVHCPELIPDLGEFLTADHLALLASQEIVRALMASRAEGQERTLGEIAASLRPSEQATLRKIFLLNDPRTADRASCERMLAGCILALQNKLNRRRLQEINQQIAVAEKDGNPTRVDQLMQRKADFLLAQNKQHGGPR